jgi:hypothetical protein
VPKVPFNPVPEVQPTGMPDDYQHIQSSPDMFGGLPAQAEQRLGTDLKQGADQVGEAVLHFRDMQNTTDALNASTGASQELGDAETKFRMLSGENATAGYPAFEKQVQDIKAKYVGQLQAPLAQQKFLQDFRSLSDRSMLNAGIHVGEQAKQAHLNALDSSIRSEQANLVRYTMTGQEPNYDNLVSRTLQLAHEKGLDKESAFALVQKTTGEAMHSMIVARVAQGDTAGASKMLSDAMSANAPGTDLPLLDATHQASLSQFIQQKQTMDANRSLTDQMRRMAYDDKVQKEAAEKAGNGYVQQMLKDPTQVDPTAIANDPNLKYEQKLQLTDRLNAALAGKGQGHDIQTYGPGFYDALRAVHAAPDDPSRITDPSQLWGMAGPGGGLTVAGVDKLTTEINGKRSSPEGEAESKMKAGALAYAKHQLSFEADYGTFKIPDPKGQDAFNVGFLPAFYQAYDAGIKAGKSPSQLLSKDSPDFIVDKVMQPFKRSPAERLKDQLDAGLEPTAGDKGAAAALAKPPAIALPALGEERDGYKFKGGNPALQASWEKIPQAPLVGAR